MCNLSGSLDISDGKCWVGRGFNPEHVRALDGCLNLHKIADINGAADDFASRFFGARDIECAGVGDVRDHDGATDRHQSHDGGGGCHARPIGQGKSTFELA